MVEEVNLSLIKRVECLSELVADLKSGSNARQGASSYMHTAATL